MVDGSIKRYSTYDVTHKNRKKMKLTFSVILRINIFTVHSTFILLTHTHTYIYIHKFFVNEPIGCSFVVVTSVGNASYSIDGHHHWWVYHRYYCWMVVVTVSIRLDTNHLIYSEFVFAVLGRRHCRRCNS